MSYCVLFRSPSLLVSQHRLPSHAHVFLSFECLSPLLNFMLICVGSFVLPSPVPEVGLTGFLLWHLLSHAFYWMNSNRETATSLKSVPRAHSGLGVQCSFLDYIHQCRELDHQGI